MLYGDLGRYPLFIHYLCHEMSEVLAEAAETAPMQHSQASLLGCMVFACATTVHTDILIKIFTIPTFYRFVV